MEKILIRALCSVLLISMTQLPAALAQKRATGLVTRTGTGPADEVDPLIGTGKSSHRTVWESYGATFPGVLVPFGMVQITPNGYHYADDHINSFSYLHHSSGWSSGGLFQVMPYTGPARKSSAFTHSRETSHPWRYDVDLLDFNIHSSFTATAHAGLARFVFPAATESHILISQISDIVLVSDTILSGRSGGIWFEAHSSKPFRVRQEDTASARKLGANPEVVLDYSTTAGESIRLRIGFSFHSLAAASENLRQEMSTDDFEKVSERNRQWWNRSLGSVEIKGGDKLQRRIFYTALYHSFFMPSIVSDAGETPGRYTPLYPWDTYRCEHPLLALLNPAAEGDMIHSTLDEYDRTGWLPTGNMLGNHNVELILDAYNKGIRNFDVGKAREAVHKSLLRAPYARRDMEPYNRLGYVPASRVNSVSETLEFAYDDWAGSQFLGLAGGRKERRTAEREGYVTAADSLLRRSFNYQHVYDAATGFMRAREEDAGEGKGSAESPVRWTSGGYCEGTQWTYSWYVPHDVQGLINLMGGKRAFSDKLTECMAKGFYVHDNEPPLHYAYLFDFAGEPWKTQQWARYITENSYSADPGGLPGNDDLGALSSWFVFSAMGFYPVTPGRPIYEIGSPLFEECVLHLARGKSFRIRAPNNSSVNKYIQAATLNGKPYNRPWIGHAALVAGGELVLEMGPTPNLRWGAAPEDAPASVTTAVPDFTLTAPGLSVPTTVAGQPVEWRCRIANKSGAAGTHSLEIYTDGRPYSTLRTLVRGHDTAIVVVPIVLYRAGRHTVTIGKTGYPQKLIVTGKEPGFVYRSLTIPLPAVLSRADRFTVSAKVKNTGSRRARTRVPLLVNHQVLHSQDVFFQPGQEKEVRFSVSGAECTPLSVIGIGDLPPLTLRILEPGVVPETDTLLLRRLGAALVMDFEQGVTERVSDVSGCGNAGEVHGQVKWVDGLWGKAIRTNSPNGDYIRIPPGSSLDSLSHSDSQTLMAWIYPTDEENFADIICKGDWTSLQLKGSNSILNFYSNGWEGHEAFADTTAGWNRHWHHIAGVTKPGYEELYIDGQLAAIKKVEARDPNGETGLHDYSGHPWTIGRNESDRTRLFKGLIDDVMIFRKALTPEEITRVMLHVKD